MFYAIVLIGKKDSFLVSNLLILQIFLFKRKKESALCKLQ